MIRIFLNLCLFILFNCLRLINFSIFKLFVIMNVSFKNELLAFCLIRISWKKLVFYTTKRWIVIVEVFNDTFQLLFYVIEFLWVWQIPSFLCLQVSLLLFSFLLVKLFIAEEEDAATVDLIAKNLKSFSLQAAAHGYKVSIHCKFFSKIISHLFLVCSGLKPKDVVVRLTSTDGSSDHLKIVEILQKLVKMLKTFIF